LEPHWLTLRNRLATVPNRAEVFLVASEIYIVSTGPDGGAFMMDDVRVEIAQNGK
jgi:hypothetical protein